MKKIIAYVISDLHIGEYGKFQSKLDTSLMVLDKMVKLAKKDSVPIIHCGDLFHSSDKMSPLLLDKVTENFFNLNKNNVPILSITGNHGSPVIHNINQEDILSYDKSFTRLFPNLFKSLDYNTYDLSNKVTIYGVPYIDNNTGLSEYLKNLKLKNKYNILVLHTDYPGAKDTDGREIGSVENLNINVLDRFDLVLCGHIHKPQRLSKKVYMVGAPYQQRRTDRDCKLGYWTLYSDLSLEFNELKGFPKFIDVESEEDILDDGNYYTLVSKPKEVSETTNKKITTGLSPKRLVKRYLKHIGEPDKNKQEVLLKLINDSSDDRVQ